MSSDLVEHSIAHKILGVTAGGGGGGGGDAYLTVQGNSGSATASSTTSILSITGSNDITTTASDGNPDSLVITGAALLPRDGGRAMTGDLDLGSNDLNNVNAIQFLTSPTHVHSEGSVHWDADDKTLVADTELSGTTIQLGQEMVLRATNKTGSTITNGQVVYVDGAQGDRPTIALADADIEATSDTTIGVATNDINNNLTGYVTVFGLVRGIDTTGTPVGEVWAEGDLIYLSSTAGGMTNIEIVSPGHSVIIGRVIRGHATEGILLVGINIGYEIDELHNVIASSPSNNDIIQYNSSNSLWENHSIDSIASGIDHAAITNIGTYAHAALDQHLVSGQEHIADNTIHFTEASIDHGSIAGLAGDDHTQYILADGTRNFSGVVVGVDPTLSTHLATKNYVDTADAALHAEIVASGVTNGNSHDHSGGDGAQIDHSGLANLSNDDHTQYALLAGRAGSQALNGGTAASETLTLSSTADGTKGKIYFGSSSAFDEVNDYLGIGKTDPTNPLHLQLANEGGWIQGWTGGNARWSISTTQSPAYMASVDTWNGLHLILRPQSGKVGIHTVHTTPANALDIYGALAVGTSYYGTAAPSNGAIIQGNVSIGNNNPGAYALNVTGTGTFSSTVEAATPTADTHLTTKLYVDAADAALNTALHAEILASGVTNGNTHDHIGGDGAQIDHTGLSNIGSILTHDNLETLAAHSYGAVVETIDIDVDASGADIQFTLQGQGATDLQVITSSGIVTVDCTPALSITLTAGTATVPQLNYVYLDNGEVLTCATDNWPATFHAPIATVLVLDRATTDTNGALKVHAYTDHLSSGTGGHISHIGKRIRIDHAIWQSGVAITTVPALSGSGATMSVSNASGSIFQMHPHTFPAFDGAVTGHNIMNDPVTPYTEVTDLATLLTDANGGSLTNKHYSLVVWGIVSEKDADCHLMLNLPTGSYNTQAAASRDADRFAVYTIPTQFIGVGFLIARLVVKNTSDSTFSMNEIEDLRGQKPSTSAGGGPGVTDHGDLAGLTDDDHTQYALLTGRSGGQALTGGTGSGDDLTLSSTSHGTKGTIFFGASSSYDEVNKRLGIGTSPSYPIDIYYGGAHVQQRIISQSGYRAQIILASFTNWWMVGSETDDRFVLYDNTDSNFFLTKTTSGLLTLQHGGADTYIVGNVGIGTDTPGGDALKVDGTALFTGTVSGITPTADNHLATKGYIDAIDSALQATDTALQAADTALHAEIVASGVLNGNSHDHSGGDGAQIDHGGLAGLSDDDHSQYHNDTRGDARYSLLGHSHGDLYYTESEVDTISGVLQTQIDGKAATAHTHLEADITDLQDYALDSRLTTVSGTLQGQIDLKADTTDLADYALNSWVNTVSGTLQGEIDAKADSSDLDNYALTSTLNTVSGTLQDQIDLKADTSALADYALTSYVNTVSGTLQGEIDLKADAADLNNYALTSELNTVSGTLQTQIDGKADSSHSHDDLYYTEAEADAFHSALDAKITASGVTNGDSHDHTSGDGGLLTLSGLNDTAVDTAVSGHQLEWNGSEWTNKPPSAGVTDHGALTGLSGDDHSIYLLASDATNRATFASNWTDLTDAGASTLHKHDHGGMDGLSGDDHTQYFLADGTRSIGGNVDMATNVLLGGTGAAGDLTLQSTSNATRGSINTDQIVSTAVNANDNAIEGTGNGSGSGVKGTGGSTGLGVEGVGNVSAEGVKGTGGTSGGYGVRGYGGTNSGGGVYGLGGTTNGLGGSFVAQGTGVGVTGAGVDGYGVQASSATASPAKAALRIVPQDADPSSSPAAGDLYINSSTEKIRTYDGANFNRYPANVYRRTASAESRTTTGDFAATYTTVANSIVAGSTIRIVAGGYNTHGIGASGSTTIDLLINGVNFGTMSTTVQSSATSWQLRADITCRTTGGPGTALWTAFGTCGVNATIDISPHTFHRHGNSTNLTTDSAVVIKLNLSSITTGGTIITNTAYLEVFTIDIS